MDRTPLEDAAIDYEAIARRLIVECEEWRSRYAAARFDVPGEIRYYAEQVLDFIREPNNQALVWLGFMVAVYVFRSLFKYLQRRKHFL